MRSFWHLPGRLHFIHPPCPEFARTFDRVWQSRIPPAARDGILAGWTSPYVFVHMETAPGRGPAYYLSDSQRFFFHGRAIAAFPCPGWVELAIARQLAHAYLFAVGRGAHALPWSADPAERRAAELARDREVSAILAEWDFDVSQQEAIDRWWRQTEWAKGTP